MVTTARPVPNTLPMKAAGKWTLVASVRFFTAWYKPYTPPADARTTPPKIMSLLLCEQQSSLEAPQMRGNDETHDQPTKALLPRDLLVEDRR